MDTNIISRDNAAKKTRHKRRKSETGTICNREVKADLSEVVRPWAAPGCSEAARGDHWGNGVQEEGRGGAQTAIGREVER